MAGDDRLWGRIGYWRRSRRQRRSRLRCRRWHRQGIVVKHRYLEIAGYTVLAVEAAAFGDVHQPDKFIIGIVVVGCADLDGLRGSPVLGRKGQAVGGNGDIRVGAEPQVMDGDGNRYRGRWAGALAGRLMCRNCPRESRQQGIVRTSWQCRSLPTRSRGLATKREGVPIYCRNCLRWPRGSTRVYGQTSWIRGWCLP